MHSRESIVNNQKGKGMVELGSHPKGHGDMVVMIIRCVSLSVIALL